MRSAIHYTSLHDNYNKAIEQHCTFSTSLFTKNYPGKSFLNMTHLVRVRLIRLWGFTQDKPANHLTHNGRATVMTECSICPACTILPFPINVYILPTTCVLCWRSTTKANYLACGRVYCYTGLPASPLLHWPSPPLRKGFCWEVAVQ